jgi:hypothetical protein
MTLRVSMACYFDNVTLLLLYEGIVSKQDETSSVREVNSSSVFE